MPVATMKDAALSNLVAPNLKPDLARAVFMRAALLDSRDTAMAAAAVMQGFTPELKEFVDAFERASTPEARRFAAPA